MGRRKEEANRYFVVCLAPNTSVKKRKLIQAPSSTAESKDPLAGIWELANLSVGGKL